MSEHVSVPGREFRLALVAGAPSHGPGVHEFRAGTLLLAQCLESVKGLTTSIHLDGEIPSASEGDIDALVIYSDGGPSHPLLTGRNLERVDALAEAGIGIGLLHYAVELPHTSAGVAASRWTGGQYVDGVSCNPIWEAGFDVLPDHPIANGVAPFSMEDEWYLNIQFTAPDGHAGSRVEPILVTTPPLSVRRDPYVWPRGPYPHIIAAEGRPETMMWATERDRGRGLGLTGGHFHRNWANDDFRRTVLNGLVWLTGMTVPTEGVVSVLSAEDLRSNLDEQEEVR